jgi:hypothetical protein
MNTAYFDTLALWASCCSARLLQRRAMAKPHPIFISLILLLTFTACNTDTRARVVIDNQSPCGTITVTLTDTTTQQVSTVKAPANERTEIVVIPDVFYRYVIDFPSGGRNADSLRCTLVDSGQLRVPAGSAQTFVLRAETPTP